MEIYIILFWYEILIALFLEKRLRKNDQIIVYSSGKLKIYVKQFTLLLLQFQKFGPLSSCQKAQ